MSVIKWIAASWDSSSAIFLGFGSNRTNKLDQARRVGAVDRLACEYRKALSQRLAVARNQRKVRLDGEVAKIELSSS
jgi:hypothetical protein